MQKVSVSNVFKLSGAYIAYLIGSGFATGQEVMQFFASFGIYGIFAAIVSALLFCFLGSTLMIKAMIYNLNNQVISLNIIVAIYLERSSNTLQYSSYLAS